VLGRHQGDEALAEERLGQQPGGDVAGISGEVLGSSPRRGTGRSSSAPQMARDRKRSMMLIATIARGHPATAVVADDATPTPAGPPPAGRRWPVAVVAVGQDDHDAKTSTLRNDHSTSCGGRNRLK
jgi:hypothetical protein